MARVGIKDIASELGLSVSTVSRAMNGDPEASAATKVLVRRTAERLGYRADRSARTLRRGATDIVAVLMRSDTTRTEVGETFYFRLAVGLQRSLADQHLDMVIIPSSSAADQLAYLTSAVDRRFADAYVLADTQREDPRIDLLLERGVPFVSLGRSARTDHASIDLDFEGVARESVRRLVARGHQRIAVAADDRAIYGTSFYLAGWRAALADAGLAADPALELRVPDTPTGGADLADLLLTMPKRPTAVMLAQETLALGMYPRLRAGGIEPGADLAVVGFRSNPVCAHLVPSLTCFAADIESYGVRLGELVIDQMGESPTLAHEIWPLTLLAQDSDPALATPGRVTVAPA